MDKRGLVAYLFEQPRLRAYLPQSVAIWPKLNDFLAMLAVFDLNPDVLLSFLSLVPAIMLGSSISVSFFSRCSLAKKFS